MSVTNPRSVELWTTEIPLNTPIAELVGHQCVMAMGQPDDSWKRCLRDAVGIVTTACTSCGHGGMSPACRMHLDQLMTYASRGLVMQCPKCGSRSMRQSEPVSFPSIEQRAAPVRERIPLVDDWDMSW